MLLHGGEHLLRSAYAVLEAEHRPGGVRGPGVLYLPNRRLGFAAPESRGVVRDLRRGRESRLVFNGSLAEVRHVSVRRGRFGRAWLVVDAGSLRPAFDVLEPEEWAAEVARAKQTLPPSGMAEPTIVVREVVRVRCRYCGNLANELAGRCASCGAGL